MDNNLSIIILAAGAGTRMKSSLPKVLHKISGKEMLYYSIKEAKKLSDDIHVVLYHQAQFVQESMEKYFSDITYHIQDHENYPGTGGAVMGITPKNEKVLVLNGDMPLIEAAELQQLTTLNEKEFKDEKLTMSILELDDASGYGRVVIDKENVVKIIEQDVFIFDTKGKLFNDLLKIYDVENNSYFIENFETNNFVVKNSITKLNMIENSIGHKE